MNNWKLESYSGRSWIRTRDWAHELPPAVWVLGVSFPISDHSSVLPPHIGQNFLSSRSLCVHVFSCFSHLQLFGALWAVAHQAPLSMGFFRQEYWNRLPCPPPGVPPNPGIEPKYLMSPPLAGSLPLASPWRSSRSHNVKSLGLKRLGFSDLRDHWRLSRIITEM